MVIIGHARCDENGHITGGKAGDQTGREVYTHTWYARTGGWRILRAKDPEVAEKIAWCMEAACKNNNIGYDQGDNQSLFYAVAPYGFDVTKVDYPVETDCSQLVRVCVSYALGYAVPYFYTGDEAAVLLATGAFVELTGYKYQHKSDYLRAGDIGVTKSKGHTWAAITDGSKAYLWDSDLTIKLQQKFGTYVDGEIWGQWNGNKRYLPAIGDGWKFKLFYRQATGSALIRAMMAAMAGYYSDDVDGVAGPNFVKAVQRFCNAKGANLDVDGYLGALTVKAIIYYIL